jgi:hypothetical protein
MCRTPWVEAKAGVRPTELLAKTGSRSVVAPVASRHLFNSLEEFRHPGISPPPQCLFVPYRVSPPRVCPHLVLSSEEVLRLARVPAVGVGVNSALRCSLATVPPLRLSKPNSSSERTSSFL